MRGVDRRAQRLNCSVTAHFTSRGFEWTLNGTYDGVRHVVWTRDWQMTARRSLDGFRNTRLRSSIP